MSFLDVSLETVWALIHIELLHHAYDDKRVPKEEPSSNSFDAK